MNQTKLILLTHEKCSQGTEHTQNGERKGMDEYALNKLYIKYPILLAYNIH